MAGEESTSVTITLLASASLWVDNFRGSLTRRPRLRRRPGRDGSGAPRVKTRRHPPPRPAQPGAGPPATLRPVHQTGQVAHRIRRTHRHPEAQLGLESHPHGRHRRDHHLVRVGCPGPQRHQDHRPPSRSRPATPSPRPPTPPPDPHTPPTPGPTTTPPRLTP